MPCRQVSTYNGIPASSGSYKTEAECLQACKEGACCEGTSCSVKPQCQCQGAGKVFKGVGTTCEGNPCGCCCIGLSATTNTEEQCAAVGGTWKGYSCNSSPPSSILLTLSSLTNYSAYLPRGPTTTSAGTWNFDFQCVSRTMTLRGNGGIYSITSGSVTAFVSVHLSGSVAFLSDKCACATPIFSTSLIRAVESAVSTKDRDVLLSQINCNAGPPGAGSSWAFELVPTGYSLNDVGRIVSVPGFCAGQYSTGGTVYGPGGVQCGTYTLGNPLP
jgi:hypothetical protein